jgi:hypothetical protein
MNLEVAHLDRRTHPPDGDADLRRRVHVDLPPIRPEDMVASQDVTSPQDPTRGHDVQAEFLIRYGAVG